MIIANDLSTFPGEVALLELNTTLFVLIIYFTTERFRGFTEELCVITITGFRKYSSTSCRKHDGQPGESTQQFRV